LLLTELLLTNSKEVFLGLPRWPRRSIRAHPLAWASALMVMFGLMQFVNSPSVASSLLSGAGNAVVIGLVTLWWRRSGGAAFSLRELLPVRKGLILFGWVLLAFYLFWGWAIKPKSIPPVFHGQLTVWIIYAALLWIFYRSLLRSRREPLAGAGESAVEFSWRGFVFCCALATAVTAVARLFLHQFLGAQIAVFFSFYVITGLALLVGSVLYAAGRGEAKG
jgi:hypothetical protein